MPRPKRIRRIRNYPHYIEFKPFVSNNNEEVLLTLEEYECVCLIDYEGLTHQECAECMEVSRTTVTEIYESSRKKIADFLVNGKKLIIAGGKYRLLDSKNEEITNKEIPYNDVVVEDFINPKQPGCKRIAIAITKDETIYTKFSSLDRLKIYDIKDGEVINTQCFYAKGMTRGQFVGVVIEAKVDVFIGYKLGDGAIVNFDNAKIVKILGIEGTADENLQKYLEGKLVSKKID